MNQLQRQRFNRLRKLVARGIEEALKVDGCCKSYEGTWEMTISYPNYFEDETATAKPDFYRIALHCYVIGPARHYTWDGDSWDECLAKCELDVEMWCPHSVEVEDGGAD